MLLGFKPATTDTVTIQYILPEYLRLQYGTDARRPTREGAGRRGARGRPVRGLSEALVFVGVAVQPIALFCQ